MTEHDQRALIRSAVRAFRLVLGRLADPAPRLGADLAQAERLLDPVGRLPLLDVDPFAALPAEPLPAPASSADRQIAPAGRLGIPPPFSPTSRPEPAEAPHAPTGGRGASAPLVIPAAMPPDARRGEAPPVFSFRRRVASMSSSSEPPARPTPLPAVHDQRLASPTPSLPPEQPAVSEAADRPPLAGGAVGLVLLGRIADELLRAGSRLGPASP